MAESLSPELYRRRRTPIAAARAGELVKIVGRLRSTTTAFTAPLSGATCLWYRASAQIYRGFSYAPETTQEERGQDVFVEDDSGSALVHLAGADVAHDEAGSDWCYEPPAPGDRRIIATTENVKRFLDAHGVPLRYHRTPFYFVRTVFAGTARFGELIDDDDDDRPGRRVVGIPERRAARYREVVLRAGDRVAVFGLATMRPDPAAHPPAGRGPAFQLILGEPPDPAVLSNRPAACLY